MFVKYTHGPPRQMDTCLAYSGHSTPYVTCPQPWAHSSASCWPLPLDSVAPALGSGPAHVRCSERLLTGVGSMPSSFATWAFCTASNDVYEQGCYFFVISLDAWPIPLLFFCEQGISCGTLRGMKIKPGSMGKAIPPYDIQVWW